MLFILALLITIFELSCSTREVPSVTTSTTKEVFLPREEPAKEAWEIKWAVALKEAKKEGKVVVFIGAGGMVRDTLVREFRQKFGIEVEALSGRGEEFTSRLFAERRAGLYNYDIYQSGPNTILLTLKPRGILDPLEPAFILPEVSDGKVWWRGNLHFIDSDKLALNFAAYPRNPLVINTLSVKKDEISSYKDLLHPKWKGKILINDPTIPGSGGHLVGVVGGNIMGYDYLRQLAQHEPLIIRDRLLQVQWVATDKYPLAVMPDTQPVMEFQKAGAPIKEVAPVEGVHVTPGYGSLALINKAPHPNAAKLYINWLLSKEGQEIYARAAVVQSGRLDVPTDFLPPDAVRDPKMKYVDISSEEYNLKMPEYLKIAQEIFGPLIK